MARAPDDMVLRLLQEMRRHMMDMRSDLREFRAEVDRRFAHVEERLDDLTARFDGMAHITVLLASRQSNHETRIEALEGR